VKKRLTTYLLVITLIVIVIISSGTGALSISPCEIISMVLKKLGVITTFVEVDTAKEYVFWLIRLPRVLLALLVGSGLAISGTTLQALFRNPLADPSFIGISSGASLFAVTMIVLLSASGLGLSLNSVAGHYTLNMVTFLGSALSAVIVYYLSQISGKTSVSTLLLSGIAINASCASLTGLLIFHSTDEQLRNVTFWMLGSLGGATWTTLIGLFPFILIPILLLPRLSKELNLFSLGEEDAAFMGVNIRTLKLKVMILSTMAVGASVAVSGMIGFVGLVVPHILRLFLGPDNRILLPASAIAGAILLSFADLISRIIIAPSEMPIGILTSLIGTPIFIWILLKHKPQMRSL
jgi:iron complex transport system permease protein